VDSLSVLPSVEVSAAEPLRLRQLSEWTRGGKAAQQFEATLIASLLDSLEKSFVSLQGEGALPGSDDYKYLGIQSLAERIAADGGFGIAEMIRRHLPSESNP
jgi:Rod binding domain-containing protein